MFKLSIAFIAILTICESNGLKHKKKDRMGYGYEGFGGGGGEYGGLGGFDGGYGGGGEDLLSEYSSDFGMEGYGDIGGYGGGYGGEGYGGGGGLGGGYGGGGGGGYGGGMGGGIGGGGYGGGGGGGGYGGGLGKGLGGGYGGGMGGGGGGGYGGGGLGGGYGGAMGGFGGGGGYGGGKGISFMPKYGRKRALPKISYKKSYEMRPLYGQKGYGQQYNVRVPYEDNPVKVMFLTQHTPVHIQQKHKRGQPEYRKATTHEEPHVVVHEVIKPVIQEIREIIVPYRKVIQKIEPVKEERKTIVSKKEGEEVVNETNDDIYKKYKKEESIKESGLRGFDEDYLKYKKYSNNEELDDLKFGGSKNIYGSRIGDLTEEQSKAILSTLIEQQGKAQMTALSGGTATLSNGLSLATIFGGHQSEEIAKSS